MAEIILDFIQCHHCGERFAPDEVPAGEHWKVCIKSPARKEVEKLRDALRDCKSAIETLDASALGIDTLLGYPIRDELLANIDKVLEL